MTTTPTGTEDLALERAQREGLPIVLATPHELLRVATGHTLIVSTTDGREVAVKVPTRDEFRSAVERSHEWHRARNLQHPSMPTDAEIDRVIQPLRVPD